MMDIQLLTGCQQAIKDCATKCMGCKKNELTCGQNIQETKKVDMDVVRRCSSMLINCLSENPEKLYKEALEQAIEQCQKLINVVYDFDRSLEKGDRQDWEVACNLCIEQCALASDACRKAEERYYATINKELRK
jgi:polyribonucleotide nucleotidyltransferase